MGKFNYTDPKWRKVEKILNNEGISILDFQTVGLRNELVLSVPSKYLFDVKVTCWDNYFESFASNLRIKKVDSLVLMVDYEEKVRSNVISPEPDSDVSYEINRFKESFETAAKQAAAKIEKYLVQAKAKHKQRKDSVR